MVSNNSKSVSAHSTLKQRLNPCSVDGASLSFLSLKIYFYICHTFAVFHIYHIVGFIIEWKWHWWFFKFSTTFAFFSHLPHCGVHYWMKMASVILQIFYNFHSFSHLPHCGVHYWMKIALVILQIFYNFCSFSHLPQCFKQFFLYAMLICASTFFQGIELIQTHFTLILMFSFIPSSSSNMSMTSTFASGIQCNLKIQSTDYQWNHVP